MYFTTIKNKFVRLDLDLHSFYLLDPDPDSDSEKLLDPNPDPQNMNADPQPCLEY